VAQATKTMLTALPEVTGAFDADREADITKAGLAIQAEMRNIIVAVKGLHSDPNGLETRYETNTK